MLALLKRFFNAPDRALDHMAIVDFLDRHASFVSQKSVTEYCRSKAGVNWDKLMLETEYLDAINKSRWEAYIHVLDDIAVMLEAHLRERFEGPARLEMLANLVVVVVDDVIKRHDIPLRPEGGWSEHLRSLKSRIGFLQEGAPHAPQDIAKVSGEKVFEVLPIHSRLRHHDQELVVNSVRLLMIGVHRELAALGDPRAIEAAITGQAGSAAE